jgi:hypothetical protein
MKLLEVLYKKEPRFDNKYTQFIDTYTMVQGGRIGRPSDEKRSSEGRYFSYKYEIYMYAVFIGIKKNYLLPLSEESSKFNNIGSWKPEEIRDYLLMSVLAKSDKDFFELEELPETEISRLLTKIKSDIEAYANGGFDIITSKAEEEGLFFIENEYSFIDLLDE